MMVTRKDEYSTGTCMTTDVARNRIGQLEFSQFKYGKFKLKLNLNLNMQMSLDALTHFIVALYLLGYKFCRRTRHFKRPDHRHICLLLIHLRRKLLKPSCLPPPNFLKSCQSTCFLFLLYPMLPIREHKSSLVNKVFTNGGCL